MEFTLDSQIRLHIRNVAADMGRSAYYFVHILTESDPERLAGYVEDLRGFKPELYDAWLQSGYIREENGITTATAKGRQALETVPELVRYVLY